MHHWSGLTLMTSKASLSLPRIYRLDCSVLVCSHLLLYVLFSLCRISTRVSGSYVMLFSGLGRLHPDSRSRLAGFHSGLGLHSMYGVSSRYGVGIPAQVLQWAHSCQVFYTILRGGYGARQPTPISVAISRFTVASPDIVTRASGLSFIAAGHAYLGMVV